ncbi:MAG: NACHT domain-containing protein [Nostocales cyanobacterium]|nr:MAG: NACHT domain-containing protein [Nostocales cyanobacterium]
MVTVKATKKGIEIIDQKRRKKDWNKKDFRWCKEANVSESTLGRFWRRIPIQTEAFRYICEAVNFQEWETIIENDSSYEKQLKTDFFAYNDNWVGREELLKKLLIKAENNCRVLIIAGMTGIGKTALAERLIIDLQSDYLKSDWTKLIAENFDHQDQNRNFTTIAAKWLELMGKTLDIDQRNDPEFLLAELLKNLQNNRYLILMDAVEEILVGDQEKGWSNFQEIWWDKLFTGLLTANYCQSLIILTSQDLPTKIAAIGSRYPNFWYCENLTGLSQIEQLDLFNKIGLEVKINDTIDNYLIRIGKIYEGHPLALKLIGGEIAEKPFNGNIAAYWQKYSAEFEKVEKAIAEAKEQMISRDDNLKIHSYNRLLQRNVELRLQRTLERLEKEVKVAYVLLCETSVYRRAVSEKFWLSHLQFWKFSQPQKDQAIDILRDRYLIEDVIENNQDLVRQHNLIRSIALEKLQTLENDHD